jgi:hypothetical protein
LPSVHHATTSSAGLGKSPNMMPPGDKEEVQSDTEVVVRTSSNLETAALTGR